MKKLPDGMFKCRSIFFLRTKELIEGIPRAPSSCCGFSGILEGRGSGILEGGAGGGGVNDAAADCSSDISSDGGIASGADIVGRFIFASPTSSYSFSCCCCCSFCCSLQQQHTRDEQKCRKQIIEQAVIRTTTTIIERIIAYFIIVDFPFASVQNEGT
jgi:hypothetical protein